jgi:hypothetical protein
MQNHTGGVDDMKALCKPIEVIASFDIEGKILPVRFRYLDDREDVSVVKIDRILKMDMASFAGNKVFKFSCASHCNGLRKTYEIGYEIDSCHWFVYMS